MSERTLGQAMNEYMEWLKAAGKSEKTMYTYGRDAEQIVEFFGAERRLAAILTPHVGKFLRSDVLLKLPSGRERAKPTVDKTIRVFRMFMIWAREQGYITKLPLPKDMPMGRSAQNRSEGAE